MTLPAFQPDRAPLCVNAPLVLASASPRRTVILQELGIPHRVVPSPLQEPSQRPPGLSPPQWAEAVSFFKAASVAEQLDDHHTLLLGADTIAVIGNDIFGKPDDRDHARDILYRLLAEPHDVITGVTVLHPASGQRMIAHARTTLVMKPMCDDAMERYLDSGEWQGKAGAYGIQDHGDALVESIDGSFTNVVGLPVELLQKMLGEMSRASM